MINWNKLEDLWERIRADANFDHLRVGQNRLVPGEGAAPIAFIVGEAPGAHEAMQLRPFVGPAGKVLRQLMALAELYAGKDDALVHPLNCWLTNVLKYRPPRNRTPTLKEIRDSRRYIRQEWAYIGRPMCIVAVGRPALACVTGNERLSVLDIAGNSMKTVSKRGEPLIIWPMVHPSYVMRKEYEGMRSTVEAHWEKLGEWLHARDSRHSRR